MKTVFPQFMTESLEKKQRRMASCGSRVPSAQPFQGGLHPIPQLQRMLGNQRVAQLIQAKRLTPQGKIIGLQPKQTVGAADDRYEQEADRVARQVVNTPNALASHSVQRAISSEEAKDQMLQTKLLAASITPFIQRQMVNNEESEDKEKPVQAKFLTETSKAPLQRQPATEEDETEPIEGESTSTTTSTPSSANVPAVAGVESIQSKIADLVKLKPKKDAYGEENAADRAIIIKSIKEIRESIAALKASDLGMNTDQLKALKAQFYLQINKATPSYFQMENLDILWMMDKGKRATAPGRTCNVTALSISLESLGISPKEFKGDKELLKLIWKYQQDQMSENSKKDEETAISKLKDKTKEKQEAALRAKGEKERTRLAALDLDGLRMPDFMQLIVIYNVLLKTGEVTGKMNGLGLDAGTIKAMAAGQPDKFKETMDSAHGLARNSILFAAQFPDFAGWFGIKGKGLQIKYSDQLDKMGAFGRARWKVLELQGQLSKTEQEADSAEGKSKERLERAAKYLRGNIATRKSKIHYTIAEQEQELASLRVKAGRATGDEQATLTAQADKLAATIEARKGKQQDKITKMETELEKLKGQQSEGAKGKAAAALEKKIKAKQGQINELKSPTSIQSMDQFETMVPLKDYKDEVMGVFVPILSAGKHVEVNLHNHFVHLFEINDNGPVVDEVGEGAGKRLQLSWEKARALGYFQNSIVYEK